MPRAEIITIGTELLLGEIQDTNTRYLARSLRDAGVDLFRTTMIGDNLARISEAIQEALVRSEIIITTGGLGPTVDDPTRLAVAQAVGVELEYREDLWDQIKNRFARFGREPSENNKRQAYIPQGAAVIVNPVGTAPAFAYEVDSGKRVIIALPGVPREMEHLVQNQVLPYLKEHFALQSIIKASVLHVASLGESLVDEQVGDLELLSNPTVGLLAHPGQVDIRVTAKAATEAEADRMISEVTRLISERLGDAIFGTDDILLESVALQHVQSLGWKLAVIESGMDGSLLARLTKAAGQPIESEIHISPLSNDELEKRASAFHRSHQAGMTLAASLKPAGERQELHMVLITCSTEQVIERIYGGPPENAPLWAVNICLDEIRRAR